MSGAVPPTAFPTTGAIDVRLPGACEVCCAPGAKCIVPERSEEWRFYVFCFRCMERMVGCFPITVAELHRRELVGSRTTPITWRAPGAGGGGPARSRRRTARS